MATISDVSRGVITRQTTPTVKTSDVSEGVISRQSNDQSPSQEQTETTRIKEVNVLNDLQKKGYTIKGNLAYKEEIVYIRDRKGGGGKYVTVRTEEITIRDNQIIRKQFFEVKGKTSHVSKTEQYEDGKLTTTFLNELTPTGTRRGYTKIDHSKGTSEKVSIKDFRKKPQVIIKRESAGVIRNEDLRTPDIKKRTGGIVMDEKLRQRILRGSETERQREETLNKEKSVYITTETKIKRPDTERDKIIQQAREQITPVKKETFMDKVTDVNTKARQEREYLASQIRAKQYERDRLGKERIETGDRSLLSKDVQLIRDIGKLKEKQLLASATETGTDVLILGKGVKDTVTKKDFWKGLGKGYLDFGKQIKEEGYIKTTKKVAVAGAVIGTSIVKQEVKEFKQDPTGKATKELLLLGGTELAVKGIVKGTSLAKGVYIRAGSKFEDPALVFSRQVLEQGKTLPTSRSVKESVKAFDDAGNVVVTASPSRIGGTEAGIGKKAGLGLEDAGIFVTPKGEGSPYFLRLGDDIATEYKFTLNPFKDISNTPTVTEFQTTGVTRLPRQVIKQAGFEDVIKYQEDVLAGTGKVQITKRSEIGLGEVQPQKFKTPSGKIVREAGTSELEGVIPKGQEFFYPKSDSITGKIKGFERYTTFKGQPVIIREGKLIQTKSGVKGVTFGDDFVPLTELKGTTTSKVSSGITNVKYSSPTPSVVSGSISSVISVKSVPTSSSLLSSSSVSENVYVTRRYDVSYPKSSVSSSLSSSSTSISSGSRSSSSSTSISSGSSTSGTSRGSGSTGFKPIPPPPRLKYPDTELEEKKKKKKKKKEVSYSQPKAYSPTLFSIFGGIKASKVKTKGLTGLGIRPILRGK